MRPIHLATLDEVRPVLVLTREVARPVPTNVTVAPITSRIRGLAVEVPVDELNGLDGPSVVSLDNVQTIPIASLGKVIGILHPHQEPALTEAILAAYDLE
jgi:mRNA interferase MazF